MRNLKQIGDSMDEVLKVTIDCEEKHIDKKIPMLDVQVWRSEDKRRVYHMFYEKPIASNLVMSAKTAIPLKKQNCNFKPGSGTKNGQHRQKC